MWLSFQDLDPDMVGKALKVNSLRCFENMQSLRDGNKKRLQLCKVTSLKNKSIFKLFVVSEWLSSSQMHNGILTEQETEQNLKEVMESNKEEYCS